MAVTEPLRTDYSDNTQTDQGTHAEAHNDVNRAVNDLSVTVDNEVQNTSVLFWMGVTP